MSWTVLRVVDEGIVLRDFHAARFANCPAAIRAAFDRFAASASPGCYSLRAQGEALVIKPRGPGSLVDGLPIRILVSPFAAGTLPLAKPPPPSAYDSVRLPGVVTLLSSADGRELYESCTAALVSWDGAQLVLVPPDRPRVASTSEAALRACGTTRSTAILASSDGPLALVNAVMGCARLHVPGRRSFPDAAVREIARSFAATVRRASEL